MSSGSSEVDVQESVMSDTSYNEEQQKTILDVLNYCQVISDAIQNLDKKFDVMHGKVSKIHRFRMKSLWQNRKPPGYAYKNYSYLLSRKLKAQKMRKRELQSTFSYPESYSPTIPVQRPQNDSQGNLVGTPFQPDESLQQEQKPLKQEPLEQEPLEQEPLKQEPLEQEPLEQEPLKQESLKQEPLEQEPLEQEPLEQEPLEQEPAFTQSSTSPPFSPYSYQPCYTPEDRMQGTSPMAYYSSPRARRGTGLFSPTRPVVTTSATTLSQGESSPAHSSDMMTNLPISPPVGTDPDALRPNFPEDPSTWTVDEVVLFLRYVDPHTVVPLMNLFRQHAIDGKALLLLKSDMMMKYMGLKLGTAVKLCHYIERLKDDK
ncbi:sex comb on midleg-like protein 1 isoform X3 [Hippopotamus amphibius kiboko]|uniref:sex comb on midleg-like protein 1 isoform X3 n=1 Tax=Hippopotamus amphibius kiboko TaxID=575201 RepID=UPI002592FFEB|nr:sex comb on midleg-like protein 1 isoform X3 [Hippopotamus amphibius kiboko]